MHRARCPKVGEARLAEARREVEAAMKEAGQVWFWSHSAGLEHAAGVAQAWSVAHADPGKAAQNKRTLDAVAAVLGRYPELFWEVHGVTAAPVNGVADAELARHFGLDPRAHMEEVMERLARHRAEACRDALVARAAAAAQLYVSYEGCGRQPGVHVYPRLSRPNHLDDGDGDGDGVADSDDDVPQAAAEVGLTLERDAARDERCTKLPVACPRCLKVVPRHELAAHDPVCRRSREQVRQLEAAVHAAAAARRRVEAVLQENDVFFNGAREKATRAAGMPQAWSINHLDPGKAFQNRETLRLIADILREVDMYCEVLGQTTAPQGGVADEKLAAEFGLDPREQVQEVMDLLAQRRAEACCDALVELGVRRELLIVRFKGCAGEMKVDFIPRAEARSGGRASERPPTTPQRALQRTASRGRDETPEPALDRSLSRDSINFLSSRQTSLSLSQSMLNVL